MISLGMILGSVVDGNPSIVVMPTRKLDPGVPVEVEGVKVSTTAEGRKVLVLTV